MIAPPQSLFLRLVREHALAVDKLTEEQLAEAIRQAMPDFIRNVHASSDGTHQQAVVYLPGREAAEWRRKYYDLLGTTKPETRCVCGFCDGEECS